MKLEPNGVGPHRPARQARPLDSIFALSDPLLGRAALIVEGHHPFGRAAQVRDQKADPRIKLARVPLDLGHDPTGAAPTLGLIAEAGVVTPDLMRRAAHRTLEQMRDPLL